MPLAGPATVCTLGLAAVLAWSGIAKARTPQATTADFARIGLPAPSALARLVPAAELVVAVALLVVPRVGGLAAVALLLGFSAVLAQILVSGRSISCGCFGADHDDPVTVGDLVRNAGLVAAAAAAATLDRLTGPALPDLVLVSAAALVVATVAQLLRLRSTLGTLFGTELAGEAGRSRLRTEGVS